jgi:putative NIF3 family GTP cyclohydrolase 1 type 2
MKTADLAVKLDDFFHLDRFHSDDFGAIIDFCQEENIPIAEYATATFLHRFNGLMLNNADDVERVFTLVFPSNDVLSEVERRAAGAPSLIFTHHPMDMETGNRGLVPIPEAWLQRLREVNISLYAAHAPMDCHETVSTSRALARAIGVPAEETFAGYFGGHAGVHGRIDPVSFEQFAERLRSALELDDVEFERSHDSVEHVAVVAGGASYPPLMQEALDAGCDTYVTGDYRIRHGGPWAEEHRPEFDAFVDSLPLNLFGGSHYGTESLVLRHDAIDLFRDLGLPAGFVPQADPWR